jgi:hypothetical protein
MADYDLTFIAALKGVISDTSKEEAVVIASEIQVSSDMKGGWINY